MAFWGVEVKPGKPYVFQHSHERGRLHLSQATLGSGSSTKKSIVQCDVGDKRPINLCSLLPERIETCALNLEFEEDGDVTFSVVGPHSVHLSGFFFGECQDDHHDDYDSDSYGEDIAETDSEESSDEDEDDDEDEYENDFIDDDFGMFPPSTVPKSGVVIEEIVDDEKPNNENVVSKKSRKKNQSKESDDTQRQLVAKSGTGVPVLESEDEDGFPISSAHKSKADVLKGNKVADQTKDEMTDEKAKKKNSKDDAGSARSLKRKADDVIPDGELASATVEVTPENDIKGKKKNKKKKKATTKDEEAKEDGDGSRSSTHHEDASIKDIDQAQPAGNERDLKQTANQSLDIDANSTANADQKEKKRKKKKKNEKPESNGSASSEGALKDKNKSTMEIKDKSEAKPAQTRTYPNGLVIDEVAMGKPDGKRASPGKQVSVHYIGKLKKNGKIFDSNVGRAPFKFRLGVGQVIKGWDVGVNGMRVGDKRRLTIPPAMGYGAKGAGAAIPPNSWLVFDVELVDVR